MKGRRYSNKERNDIIKDYKSGMTYHEIQKKYGVSKATFYKWVKRTRRIVGDNTEIQKLKLENEKLKKWNLK